MNSQISRDALQSLAFLALFVCLCAPAISRSAASVEPLPSGPMPDGLGVNIHFTHAKPGELEMIAAAGFKWIRMDLDWAGIEQKKGEYNFSAYDRLLNDLDKFGIRAVLILDYGNRLYDSGTSPNTDEARGAFAKWAAATVHHFKGRGVLWEMWNEPNGSFWKPKANVDEYAKLALATGKAIRDAEPAEPYIGPATSGVDLKFMEACFRAGCLEYWSAVSCHPYRQSNPETAAGDYRKLRLLIARYAPPGKKIPILSGEWGYSAAWTHFDEHRQGKYLARQWLTNQWQQVPLSIWYDWHDDGINPQEPEHHFGTVHNAYREGQSEVYEPKSPYLAAKTLTTQLAGFRFNKRLMMPSPDDFVLLFDKGPDVRIAAWTTAKEPHEVTLPASAGEFSAVSHVGISMPIVPANEKGLTVTLNDAPLYLSPNAPNDILRLAAAISRLPLEIPTQAPAEFQFTRSMRNPLDHDVTIPQQGELAGQVLKPGREAVIHQSVKAMRSAAVETRAVSWKLSADVAITQQTSVVVLNPLIAHIHPLHGRAVGVRIEDPSRHGFKGSVQIISEDKPGQAHSPDIETAIDIPPGEGEGEFALLVGPTAIGQPLHGSLLDEQRHEVLAIPAMTFESLPDFAAGALNGKTTAYKLQPDGDAKVVSEQSLSVDVPPESSPAPGMGVLKISYNKPRPGWKFWQVQPTTPDLQKIEGKPKALGLWVHGDASGASQRIRFTDSTGQTFQSGTENIIWTGWNYVEFLMTADSREISHWGGAKDGVIHYPIHWDAIYLIDRDSKQPAEGTVYISGATLIR